MRGLRLAVLSGRDSSGLGRGLSLGNCLWRRIRRRGFGLLQKKGASEILLLRDNVTSS